MATDRMAYDTLQTTMARQRVTVYDLYGLLGVSPNASEASIREAYEALAKKVEPNVPSNVINVAYSILINPHKRAQYDRDRLEYLYTHFSSHESFPPTSTSSPKTAAPTTTTTTTSSSIDHKTAVRDEQIQVYATTLTDRVRDPLEDKKKAISSRLARTRDELDEFNEKSTKSRQDWATSANRILRMAGNALREIVVCAEEDLCMLEDELGRLNGILAPRDTDGPAGRVTSSGQYGSEMDLAGGAGVGVGALQGRDKSRYGVLAAANHRPPSIPRSPTVPIKPLSASKLGVQGEDSSGKGGDSSGSEGVGEALADSMADDRVNKFLLGPAQAMRIQSMGATAAVDKPNVVTAAATIFTRDPRPNRHVTNGHRGPSKMFARDLSLSDVASTIKKANTNSPSPSTLEKIFPPRPIGMGLVEWQTLNGGLSETKVEDQGKVVSETLEDDQKWSGDQHGHIWSIAAYDDGNDDIEALGAPLPAKIQKRVNHVLSRDSTKPSKPSYGLLGEGFKKPLLQPLRPGATENHPEAHFMRIGKGINTSKTNSLALATINNRSSGESGSMMVTTTGSNFGFHVSQPSDRAIPPPGVAATMQARSAGIKDFQVRVWSAAKAAKSGGEPQSGATQEQLKESDTDDHYAGDPGAAATSSPESDSAALRRNTSPNKDRNDSVRPPVFRRTKPGMVPVPSEDKMPKNNGHSTAGLDDPFN